MFTNKITEAVLDCKRKIENITGSRVIVKYEVLKHPRLFEIVCDVVGVDADKFFDRFRKTEMVRARHIYWWYSMRMFKRTCTDLALEAGVDHTTVLYGVKTVDNYIEMGVDNICDDIAIIRQQLKAIYDTKTLQH